MLKSAKEFLQNVRYLKLVRTKEVVLLLVLTVLGTLFEGVSIAMLLPLLEFIESGKNVESLREQSQLWQWIVDYHSWAGVGVTLLSLMATVLILVIFRQIFDYSKRLYTVAVSER